MPLETSSSDPRDATLGLGVGDALVSDLAGTRGIVVAPSRTDDGPPRRTADVARVARALGASFVVDGGVQVVGEQVRINLRVMRPDGAAVRGVAEQGARSDLLRLQRNLAVALIEIFTAHPDVEERARIDRQPEPAIDTIRIVLPGTCPARAAGSGGQSAAGHRSAGRVCHRRSVLPAGARGARGGVFGPVPGHQERPFRPERACRSAAGGPPRPVAA